MAETFDVGDVVSAIFPNGAQWDKVNVLNVGKTSNGKVYYELSPSNGDGTWVEEDRCFKVVPQLAREERNWGSELQQQIENAKERSTPVGPAEEEELKQATTLYYGNANQG